MKHIPYIMLARYVETSSHGATRGTISKSMSPRFVTHVTWLAKTSNHFRFLLQWPYEEFVSIVPNVKAPANNEFIITVLKPNRKTDTMRFSTDHRADLLSEALRFRNKFAERSVSSQRFNSYKAHWSDNRVPVVLEVNPGSLDQVDPATNRLLCCYDYKDMEGIAQVSTDHLEIHFSVLASLVVSVCLNPRIQTSPHAEIFGCLSATTRLIGHIAWP